MRHPPTARALGLGLLPLLWMAACCLAGPAHAATALVPLSVTVQVDGQPERAVAPRLPLHWDAEQRGRAGSARLLFDLPPPDGRVQQALLLTRIGNSYRVRLDGQVLASQGEPGNAHHDYAKRPRLVLLPLRPPGPAAAAPGRLEIEIDAQPARKAGVGAVLFGPAREIIADHADRTFVRWDLTLVIVAISSTLGTLSLMLWLRQRERLYLVYGAGELLFALHASDTLFSVTPLPWPWWGAISYSAHGLAWLLMLQFALIGVGRAQGALARTNRALMVLIPLLLTVSVVGAMPALELLVLMGVQLMALAAALAVIRDGLRSQELEKRTLALAMAGLLLVLARDAFVLVIQPYSGLFAPWGSHYGETPWSRYGWVAFGITMAWTLAERLRHASQEVSEANRQMAWRLALQEKELQLGFQRQLEDKRLQARLDERQRLTRDMHDGLGAQLIGALHLARNPVTPRAAVTAQLEQALDHLKLTVDAMHDTEGDLGSLLGALRYRIEPRLEAAGVQLAWAVQELPEIEAWTLDRARDLQMILYEGISNILTHAHARHATISARYDVADDRVVVVLADDGRGFAAEAAMAADDQAAASSPWQGRGLLNMQLRAGRLGAQLGIRSNDQGSTVELSLPRRALSGTGRAVASSY